MKRYQESGCGEVRKKLNLFSRSFSFPSLLRMVTPPASPALGEMGGIVMARLRARGPTGESADPAGMEPMMERIQELISAFKRQSKHALNVTIIGRSRGTHTSSLFKTYFRIKPRLPFLRTQYTFCQDLQGRRQMGPIKTPK
ncbi:hypothetical protein EYF80_017268 [Liparis tanakae]|uniref:Uncharacterized protein n=1 Tax=Liparis tanakae TaxID=230148 RepID=A0A4Z2I5E1_9TELE|nr:hypothetical protein EYF80_017268 [Liparis tanakae]